MKLFLLATSLRRDSSNKKLINICAKYLHDNHEIKLHQMDEFDLPLYNADIQDGPGIPVNAQKMAEMMQASDKIIFSVPEYNYSIPGTFKNLIDWISRIRPNPWKGLKILLISASPSLTGGHRGHLQTRVILESCGSFVYPGTFSLGDAYAAFNENNNLKDEKLLKTLRTLLEEFITS